MTAARTGRPSTHEAGTGHPRTSEARTARPRTRHPRTRHPRLRRLGALAALLVLAAATACAQEADQDPTAGADTSASDGGGGANSSGDGSDGGGNADDGSGTMDWQTCGGGAECAELEVPLDYGDPEGDTIPISVARVPATGDRIGALFINPGGPGALATEYAAGIAFQLPSELTERFDIVGVDPRGLGSSDIDCGGDFAELYAVDYSIDSPEDEDELLSISQDYVDGCQDAAGDLLPHLGTENVARDIDAVREAMGDEQLNYLGFSYGTAIGQMMAELFPERIRSIIIDGVLELGPTGVELADDQSLGFESALAAFVEDCDGDPSCPIGPDAEAAIDDLMAQVEDEPIAGSPRDLTPGTLAIGMAGPLYNEFAWPDLAQAVADALDGDGSGMVAQADQYLSSDFDVYFAVNCIDFAWPDTPEELLAAGAETAQEAPHFGEPIVNDYVRCSMWPAEGEPLPAVTAPEAPPILVVSTTNDPATPYEAGVRTAERLETGVLLTYEGEGHTAVASGVPCIDDIVVDYLVDLEVPEDESTC